MPSVKELFNIIAYFDMTVLEFFAPMENTETPYSKLCEKLRTFSEENLEKVGTFANWIEK